jgi:hypothetical protein
VPAGARISAGKFGSVERSFDDGRPLVDSGVGLGHVADRASIPDATMGWLRG